MHPLVYSAPLWLLPPSFAAMLVGGPLVWLVPVVTFGILPVVDQLSRGTHHNPADDEAAARLADGRFDALLIAVVPAQVALLLLFLTQVSRGALTGADLVGATATMGIACGVYGINVAHELGHRTSRTHQRLAQVLLLTSLYLHFFVEHNRGHHRRVATPDDPASARRGETVYAFWLRSIPGSWRHAWQLENDRVQRAGQPWWSWDNQMVRFTTVEVTAVAVVGFAFGPWALLHGLAAAALGALLLETVNYLEHYGLTRNLIEHGVYERVRPAHSWTSDRPAGRAFLFDLTRHADHHAHAARPFSVLRHFDEAPELPMGYPAMILLALVPPLFFAVMDPALDQRATA